MGEENNETPVSTDVSALSLNDTHRMLLVLSTHGDKLTTRAALSLYLWLSEFPGQNYPETKTLTDLLGVDRFQLSRAEKQLSDAGLVRFEKGAKVRRFFLTPCGEVLQTQLIAYNEIFAAPVAKGRKSQRKTPATTDAPANDLNTGSGQNNVGQQDAKDVGTTHDEPAEPKQGRSKLTSDDVAKICSDLNSMLRYIRFGKEAVYDPTGTYPPSHLNWERFAKSPTDPGVEDWSVKAFMGFYWASVSNYRATRNIPLSLPVFDTLSYQLANMLKRVTKLQAYQIITFVIYYFDVIRWTMGQIGNTTTLDESSLANPIVQNKANALMAMSQPEREELLARYAQAHGQM